jgi:hypothetical protein
VLLGLPERYAENSMADLRLDGVRQLEAVAGEELDPVVLMALWLTEIITPAWQRMSWARKAMTGVEPSPFWMTRARAT